MTGKTCDMCGRQFHKHYHLKHHYYKAHGIVDPSLKVSNQETVFTGDKVLYMCNNTSVV